MDNKERIIYAINSLSRAIDDYKFDNFFQNSYFMSVLKKYIIQVINVFKSYKTDIRSGIEQIIINSPYEGHLKLLDDGYLINSKKFQNEIVSINDRKPIVLNPLLRIQNVDGLMSTEYEFSEPTNTYFDVIIRGSDQILLSNVFITVIYCNGLRYIANNAEDWNFSSLTSSKAESSLTLHLVLPLQNSYGNNEFELSITYNGMVYNIKAYLKSDRYLNQNRHLFNYTPIIEL
jgi:hypothetical protein